MKKRNRWHRIVRKIKSLVKNTILIGITTFAVLMLLASMEVLFEQTLRAFTVFTISLAWVVLFCHVNGWLKESQ